MLLVQLQKDRMASFKRLGQSESANQFKAESVKEISKELRGCAALSDLEALIDEAENLNLDQKNKKFDKLIDYHCKVTDLQTESRKLYSNRNMLTKKVIQQHL